MELIFKIKFALKSLGYHQNTSTLNANLSILIINLNISLCYATRGTFRNMKSYSKHLKHHYLPHQRRHAGAKHTILHGV